MSEETRVIQSTTGYGFSFSVEQEIRKESGTKYPDKIVVKASVNGHSPTYIGALGQLLEAQEDVRKTVKQYMEEKNNEESSGKLEETQPN